MHIVFLCGSRDFHAMDWYKSSMEICPEDKISILTDLIGGEGYKVLINHNDVVDKLIILDRFLFKKESSIGNVWRRALKLFFFPIQVILLRKYYKSNKSAIFYAHSMYYLFLAWAAKVKFIGTPQGSDILVNPYKSKLYKYLAAKSMRAAKAVTVDSVQMRDGIYSFSGVEAVIVQNGIDMSMIDKVQKSNAHNIVRNGVLSIRGFTKLYRIKEIIKARNESLPQQPINFIYPFIDAKYMDSVLPITKKNDKMFGRIDCKEELYSLLSSIQTVISIPISDSSPRSVYESIFCGAVVGINYNPYYDILPQCMKDRIVIVDINKPNWFKELIRKSDMIIKKPFVPTQEAIDLFDQIKSFLQIYNLMRNINN